MSADHPRGHRLVRLQPVAANLLMLLIMVVGLGAAFSIQRAMFPAIDIEMIFITAPYPGAAPEEVEQGVVRKMKRPSTTWTASSGWSRMPSNPMRA